MQIYMIMPFLFIVVLFLVLLCAQFGNMFFIKTELWLTADISGFYFVLTYLQNNKVKMKVDLYNELTIQTVIALNIVIR